MLNGLLENKDVEKILLFLFVNTQCYEKQFQKCLDASSLEKAFSQLKREGILISQDEANTKIFQLNPTYPLLAELEKFLKKSYLLLSAQEKKLYSFVQEEESIKEMDVLKKEATLCSFWERLATVKKLALQAKTKSKREKGWNSQGEGDVRVIKESSTVFVFQERGTWAANKDLFEISFTNHFRWTFDKSAGRIALEHLRLGIHHPVFLFHLAPTGENILSSVDSHVCKEDTYLSRLSFNQKRIHLMWRVIGPKKNEQMECFYY